MNNVNARRLVCRRTLYVHCLAVIGYYSIGYLITWPFHCLYGGMANAQTPKNVASVKQPVIASARPYLYAQYIEFENFDRVEQVFHERRAD